MFPILRKKGGITYITFVISHYEKSVLSSSAAGEQ
jgi:hypothetical protein